MSGMQSTDLDNAGEQLDAGFIQSHLTAEAAEYIDRLTVLDVAESTNSWVKQQPEPGVVACLAEEQTGGRGRRGRSWSSPAGCGVLLSVRAPLEHPASALSMLSMQAGLGVLQAIKQVTGLAVQLKWPNDVMLDGSKLAGILVELQSSGPHQTTVVIGTGINVRWPESEPMPQPLADCRAAAKQFTRNQLAAGVLNELSNVLMHFGETAACSVVASWWQNDLLADQPVQIEQGGKRYTGRAAGLDQDGGFVLDTGNGVMTFHSSEASIRLINSES